MKRKSERQEERKNRVSGQTGGEMEEVGREPEGEEAKAEGGIRGEK